MVGTVSQLNVQDLEALRGLLAAQPVENLYLLGLLEDFGIAPNNDRNGYSFYGRFEGPKLTATVFVGGSGTLMVPSASPATYISDIASALNSRVHLRAALGEAEAIAALLKELRTDAPRYSRFQKLWSVSADDLGPFTNPTLRLATMEDVPELLHLAQGYVRECLERDPQQESPEGFYARITHRVRLQRTYVLYENQRLVFKVDVGSRSKFGAELEGIYTLPDERRKRHAILSVGQISRHLLSSLPRLTMRIDEENSGLAHIVRRVGYAPTRTQRVVWFDEATGFV